MEKAGLIRMGLSDTGGQLEIFYFNKIYSVHKLSRIFFQ
jgi:hypothetical protein